MIVDSLYQTAQTTGRWIALFCIGRSPLINFPYLTLPMNSKAVFHISITTRDTVKLS